MHKILLGVFLSLLKVEIILQKKALKILELKENSE
jgi:hypothetical protein